MSINMKTFTQALAKASAAFEKTVSTTVQEVTGPRPLQDYDLLDQSGSGGPGLAWRIYPARPRSTAPSTQYPLVSVWVLDKKALTEARTRAGLTKSAEDAFLDLIRADAAKLVRIRHPGVLHVVQALDESKGAMAMATEPVFASVANAMGNCENIGRVPKELKGMEMGLLEIKHGLLQVAETLDFLHNNAHLAHRAISPDSVYITLTGSWKLGGFGFAIPVDQPSGGLTSTQQFHYSEYDVEDTILPLQPSLNYSAPELVRNGGSAVSSSCDMFSFGCLAYHLVARKPLLDCHNNVKMYMNCLTYLTSEAYSNIPTDLVVDLQRMFSIDATSRPTASDFTGSSFFRDDTRLRALRFLDHMLERDNMQKTEFLKALSDMWKDFDSRVLRYKVLPPLCAELRNMVMQPMILPMVLTIAESQDKNDFELSTLPALVPVYTAASGETLLLLVKHADLIITKGTHEHLISHILPMLVRAYDDTDPRIQEEVLRRTVALARQLDTQLVKQSVLPRVHGLALKTTVAAVRVNALRCLGDLVPSLDKIAILEILQTLRRCTAVDHSAPTLMCTLGVANAIYKQCGVEFAAEHLVPLLFPLLNVQQLNVQQFAKYMLFVKDIIRKIEEKRGVTISDTRNAEVKVSVTNGISSESLQGPIGQTSAAKSIPAWDEDWGSTTKKTSTPSLAVNTDIQTKKSSTVSQTPAVAVPSMPSLAPNSGLQASDSCTPVDVEWPPRSTSFNFNGPVTKNEEHKSGGIPSSGLDDLDPFVSWPPKQSHASSISGFEPITNPNTSISDPFVNWPPKQSHASSISGFEPIANPNTSISRSNMGNAGFSSSNNSIDQMKNQGNLFPMQTNNSMIGMNSVGQLNQENSALSFGNPIGGMGTGYSNVNSSSTGQFAGKTNSDFGSILLSTSSTQPTPRLAPPPGAAVGRGRGRNQGQSALSRAGIRPPAPGHSNASSEQSSILDLLQ